MNGGLLDGLYAYVTRQIGTVNQLPDVNGGVNPRLRHVALGNMIEQRVDLGLGSGTKTKSWASTSNITIRDGEMFLTPRHYGQYGNWSSSYSVTIYGSNTHGARFTFTSSSVCLNYIR